MKNFIRGIGMLLIISFVLAGCKKDSKDETRNFLKVDGAEYDISTGLIINYGEYDSAYEMDIYLFSPGLTVHEAGGFPDSLSGTGHAIYFEMVTTATDKLAIGDYPYNDTEIANSFYYSEYFLNWNPNTNSDDNFVELKAGNVKVIQNGTEYELSFTGTDENNKAISGYYKGTLKYYTDFKKSGKPHHLRK